MDQLFAGRIKNDDVLVDVGCGRGRVINHWLKLGLKNKIYGLEIDPSEATKTARRLQKWKNVSIRCGNAIEILPGDATLVYLFNPFTETLMRAFSKRLLEMTTERKKRLTVIYYAPVHLDVFLEEVSWHTEVHAITVVPGAAVQERHRTFVVIQPACE